MGTLEHDRAGLTIYMYTVYLFTQGRGEGRREMYVEKVKGTTVHKAGSKIPT